MAHHIDQRGQNLLIPRVTVELQQLQQRIDLPNGRRSELLHERGDFGDAVSSLFAVHDFALRRSDPARLPSTGEARRR